MPDCTVAHACDTPSPNPHTSQPDPHMASGHILIVSLSTIQKNWLQQFAAHVRGLYVRMSTWVFSCLGHRCIFASSKNDFLFRTCMRHEVSPSSRHRSTTMLSKAKHLTPTPSNAARRCAQRDRQFVWQRRSHSQADDLPGAAFFAHF